MAAERYVHPLADDPSLAATQAEPAVSSCSIGSPDEHVACSRWKPAMLDAGTWDDRMTEHRSKKSLNASAHLASQVVGTPPAQVVAADDAPRNRLRIHPREREEREREEAVGVEVGVGVDLDLDLDLDLEEEVVREQVVEEEELGERGEKKEENVKKRSTDSPPGSQHAEFTAATSAAKVSSAHCMFCWSSL